jgi:hypothetical protein
MYTHTLLTTHYYSSQGVSTVSRTCNVNQTSAAPSDAVNRALGHKKTKKSATHARKAAKTKRGKENGVDEWEIEA